MFSLVKFDNNEQQVIPTKNLQKGNDKKCTVNCRGSKYSAVLLKSHDSKEFLVKRMGKNNVKKRKKQLHKVALKDILNIKKAQNNSVLEIISNKPHVLPADDIQLPADCESYYNNGDDLPIAQFIDKYDVNLNPEMETEIGVQCKGTWLPGAESTIEVSNSSTVKYTSVSCYGITHTLLKSEKETDDIQRHVLLPTYEPEKEHDVCDGVFELYSANPETEPMTSSDDAPEHVTQFIEKYDVDLKPDMETEIGVQRKATWHPGAESTIEVSDSSTVKYTSDSCYGITHTLLKSEKETDNIQGHVLLPTYEPEKEHDVCDGVFELYSANTETETMTSSDDAPEHVTQFIEKYDVNLKPDMETEIGVQLKASPFELEEESGLICARVSRLPVVDPNIAMELSDSYINTTGNDSTYIPDKTNSTLNDISQTTQIFKNDLPVDIRNITVPPSKNSDNKTHKKYFCPFCNKLQTKFARHLELIHKQEAEVQKFLTLPKGNTERKKIIETIRKNGNFKHNTESAHNTGILITCRQQVNNHNSAEDYVCCKNCKGFFSKKTIRLHYHNCCQRGEKKGAKQIMVMGRRLAGYIHPRASATLRRKVFPVLRDDDITRLVKYDELIIIFGNRLCEKYTSPHQHDMIRSHIRLLGRFLTAVRDKEKAITDLASVFKPVLFDAVLQSIKLCASYNSDKEMFEAPSVATTLGTLLKKCLKMHMSECIKTQNDEAKKAAENFLILFEEDTTSINRKVLQDQQRKKRDTIVQLPTKSDISCLSTYLKAKMIDALDSLKKHFNLESYNRLQESTLVLLQTFNRRRAGEMERLLITDYHNQETIDNDANSDLYDNVSPESRKRAQKFVRITIRGKLGRIVPVLLDTFIVKCIDMMMACRRKAGITPDNEYVFAVAGDGYNKKYLRACPLMRKFSEQCGAKTPATLRGTTLRKHVATHTAMQGIEDREVSDLANFMGHHKDIHKDVYRIPVPIRDLTNVSRLLEDAMGSKKVHESKSEVLDNFETIGQTPNVASSVTPLSGNENEDAPVLSRKRAESFNSDSSRSCEQYNFDEVGHETNEGSKPTPRRSTSPFGKTKRVRWNEGEKAAITDCFGDPVKCVKLPSLSQCFDAIKSYEALKNRTPQQIKTWIDNQRKAKSRLQAYKVKCRKS